MKTNICYFIILLFPILSISCTIDRCSSGNPVLSLEGFSKTERSLIEVKEYESGSGWSKLSRTFYTGDSIKTQGSDSIARGDFSISVNNNYMFKILSTGSTYTVYNMQHKIHRMKRYIGSSNKGCTNGFSYWVNTNKYTVAPNENPGYGLSEYVRLTIYK